MLHHPHLNQYRPKKKYWLMSDLLAFMIISFGICVRLIQYISNRSLWADEATLALNIVNRSYSQLLQPLDYGQGAPIGFLMVEKLAVQVFGDNEYALRLFPLVSGIFALFLFYQLTKIYLQKWAIPIALVLFVSLPKLIYYSTELKQYSSDVTTALILCLLLIQIGENKIGNLQIFTLSIVGSMAIWFSHPSILILAGLGISYFIIGIKNGLKKNIFKTGFIYLSWFISFAIFYYISLNNLSSNTELLKSWQNAFPSSIFNIIWLFDAFGKFFYDPLGFLGKTDGLAIIIFVIGCISLFIRRKEILFVLISPVFATFLATYLHKYPFRGRLVLFLTPLIILIIAEGAYYILKKSRSKLRLILSTTLLLFLIIPPLYNASNLIVMPQLKEEIKPVISYIKERQQPGDILYIYQRGKYQFKYYAKKYGYQEGDYIIGVDDLDKYDGSNLSNEERERYEKDLDKLMGNKRVWLLFSHANISSENEMMKSSLERRGKKIDFFARKGAFVYLYDLTGYKAMNFNNTTF